MHSHNIPPEHWSSFFDRFSKEHAGWPVTIEVLNDETGPQQLARELPLQGISIDPAGTRPCSIRLGAGDQPDANTSHALDMPLYVRVLKNEDGSAGTIQIEPARGPAALVHFHQPY